jgi:hypothetical protein|nr:MAG TPA: hypothetical protein [Caudoviricetes sp.]
MVVLIDGKIYDAVPYSELHSISDTSSVVAIMPDGKILPLAKERGGTGIYISYDTLFGTINEENCPTVTPLNIDTKGEDIKSIITKNEKNRNVDFEQVSAYTSDNKYKPAINGDEYKEMELLKKAISAKNIDINAYEHRFGGKFQNDKRLLTKNSISIDKLKSTADALDMEVEIIIRDKKGDIPNPMGTEFRGVITEEV